MIEIDRVSKIYDTGTVKVHALDDVSLTIGEGEFVAIMGPSGSGKSTLLNILGFLDRPDRGAYRLLGRDISSLGEDELSILRNHMAGFVFQQFNLLPKMTAAGNTMLPLIYAGKRGHESAASDRLSDVGLSQRERHYPNELSGGEQQRVAIARAMVNNPMIIFADEPTGNLDTRSEEEIMSLIEELNDAGKTIIMVTHEDEVARRARRIIRMRDGKIVEDITQKKRTVAARGSRDVSVNDVIRERHSSLGRAEFVDYLRQAVTSIVSHKLRSMLSMLGILIGVAAVISMVAIGEGAKEAIAQDLSSLGSNILTVRPGSRRVMGVALQAGAVTRFTEQDAKALSRLTEVNNVVENVIGRCQILHEGKNWNSQVWGVGIKYPEVRSAKPILGRFFSETELRSRKKVALLGQTVVRELFAGQNPVGKSVKINRVNFSVIGVLPAKGSTPMMDQDDIAVIPVTTAMYRLLGKEYIDTIDVEIADQTLIEQAKVSMNRLIRKRHRIKDSNEESFEIRDMSEIRNALSSMTQTMSLLLGIVAAISLVVGGIGIMNIMLVSVKERIKEIGLRKALGARRRDILVQFLIEAALLTFSGGMIGIALGSGISMLISLVAGWNIKISPWSIVLSSVFSVLIGICFGLWPAVQASRLNPIEALRYE